MKRCNVRESLFAVTAVAILPVPDQHGGVSYPAVAGVRHPEGRTAGEALDALTAQLPKDDAGILVVVQQGQPDWFFTAAQQRRLAELMERWRSARDSGSKLDPAEQSELDELIEAELAAATERAAALADAVAR